MAENRILQFLEPPYAPAWRIGHLQDTLAFAPHQSNNWSGRFDDPQRTYRTLYCAECESTALLGALSAFRPSIEESTRVYEVDGEIPREWLRKRVMIPAKIEVSSGQLIDITDPGLRYELEQGLSSTLIDLKLGRLDLYSAVHNRGLSRRIGRLLYEKGAAGLAYPSPHDSGLCFALFEGRARLTPAGEAKSMEETVNARSDILSILGLSTKAAYGAPPPQRSPIYQLNHIDLLLYSQLQNHPELLRTLDWRVFEKLLADILETLGYTVDLTRPTKDGGIDIIAIGKPELWGEHCYVVQAKRWNKRVGIEPVRELMFLQSDLRATRACLATTSTFTKGAWELSDKYRWQLELRDYEGLKEWIEKAFRAKRKAS